MTTDNQLFRMSRFFRPKVLALILIAMYPLVSALLAPVYLYADGTNFFFDALILKNIWDGDFPRLSAQIILQMPLALSLKLGVDSIGRLGFIYNLSLVFIPASLWCMAIWLQRNSRYFWPFVLVFSTVSIPVSLFAVSEVNACLGLNALIFSILLIKKKLSEKRLYFVAVLTLINSLTYELNALLAPLTIYLIFQRFGEIKKYGVRGCAAGIAAIIACSVAVLVSIHSILTRDASSAGDAVNIASLRLYAPISISVLAAGFLPFSQISNRAKWTLLAIVPLVFVYPVALARLIAVSGHAYIVRVSSILAVVAAFLPAFLMPSSLRIKYFSKSNFIYELACLYVLIFSLLFGAIRAQEFGNWIRLYQGALDELTQSTTIDKTNLFYSKYYRYSWPWNNLQTSLILGANLDKAIYNASDYNGYEPTVTADDLAKWIQYKP